LLRTSGAFCYEHPPPTFTHIRSFHSEHPTFFVPNIRTFLLRTSIHFEYKIAKKHCFMRFRTSRRLSLRTSGICHYDLPYFSFRTSGLFQRNWGPLRTSPTDVRKKKRGRKGVTPKKMSSTIVKKYIALQNWFFNWLRYFQSQFLTDELEKISDV